MIIKEVFHEKEKEKVVHIRIMILKKIVKLIHINIYIVYGPWEMINWQNTIIHNINYNIMSFKQIIKYVQIFFK